MYSYNGFSLEENETSCLEFKESRNWFLNEVEFKIKEFIKKQDYYLYTWLEWAQSELDYAITVLDFDTNTFKSLIKAQEKILEVLNNGN